MRLASTGRFLVFLVSWATWLSHLVVFHGFQTCTWLAWIALLKEYYAIFSVAYKLIIGFAAVGIINAVFMQETFKVAASDDKLMMRQKARESYTVLGPVGIASMALCLCRVTCRPLPRQERDRMLHTKKMRTLFAAADESGDGVLEAWTETGETR